MSSTTGVQNLLVNVFQPYYTYDPLNTLFTPVIELANVNSAGASVTDTYQNVYVGTSSGNAETSFRNSTSNVAVGYAAASFISNTTTSVFIGYTTGASTSNASNTVVIGASTTVGSPSSNSVYIGGVQDVSGSSNVYVGARIKGSGVNNVLIGAGIDISSANNTFRVGSNYLYGDLSNKWLGVGYPTASSTTARLDVSGAAMVTGGIGSFTGTITSAAIGSTTSIATLKKGVILVSAQDTANSTTHYQSIQVYCSDATNGTYTTAMTNAVQSGQVSIVFEAGGSNIQISNATSVRNIGWSVTYFPVP